MLPYFHKKLILKFSKHLLIILLLCVRYIYLNVIIMLFIYCTTSKVRVLTDASVTWVFLMSSLRDQPACCSGVCVVLGASQPHNASIPTYVSYTFALTWVECANANQLKPMDSCRKSDLSIQSVIGNLESHTSHSPIVSKTVIKILVLNDLT